MTNTDMFAVINTATAPTVQSYWSVNHNTPGTKTNHYTLDSVTTSGSDKIYVVSRALNTGGGSQHYVINTDEVITICWAYKNSQSFVDHGGNFGDF